MSTSQLDTSGVFQPVNFQSAEIKLSIPANGIRFRSSGIEFTSARPVPLWAEMTVDLHSPLDQGKRVRCTGVIVECNGNRHTGYLIAMVLMNLSRQAQERLTQLAAGPPRWGENPREQP